MIAASLSGLDERDMADILAIDRRVVDALRGARILVTGATGWFGTWLLDGLVALEHEYALGLSIVAVSRDPDAFRSRHPSLHGAASIEWIRADVRDPVADVPGLTHVIHAATETSAKPDVAGGPDALFETIVRGTRNVLGLAARSSHVKVLIVSSGAVYGPQPVGMERLAEDHRGAPDPLDAASAYSEGKRAAELLGAIWHATRGVHVTIARCFAFVGPHMPLDAHFAIGNFVRDARGGREVVVHGDGTPMRSYQYMSDLVVWLLTILIAGRAMRPYNVGGDEVVSIAGLARRTADLCEERVPVRIGVRGEGGVDYVPDVARARIELGLSNRVPLDEAIERTMAWSRRIRPDPERPSRRARADRAPLETRP